MKVSFSSNWGRFDYTLTAEIADGLPVNVVNIVANEGLANLGFRACGSNVEKALVDAEVMEKTDKRNSVVYSAENAKVIQDAAQTKLDELSESEDYPAVSIKVGGEHVFGETEASRKMATELFAKVKTNPALGAGIPGYGDAKDDNERVESCHAFLASLRSKPVRKAKA